MKEVSGTPTVDYYLAVTRDRSGWVWQIHRRSRPMGVKVTAGGYKLEHLARLAGEKALRDFLNRLAEEIQRSGNCSRLI